MYAYKYRCTINSSINSSPPGQNVAISQTFSNAFSWMKIFIFWFEHQWSFFLRVQLTILQHWFRWWLGPDQATSHYLNQCWPNSLTHTCGTRGRWVNSYLIGYFEWHHLIKDKISKPLTQWPLGNLNVILKIFNLALLIGIFKSCDNVLRWMPQNLTDGKSTLIQVMAWCRQATSRYLN